MFRRPYNPFLRGASAALLGCLLLVTGGAAWGQAASAPASRPSGDVAPPDDSHLGLPEPIADPRHAVKREDGWHYMLRGQRVGPIPARDIRRLYGGGKLTASSGLWRRGLKAWTMLVRLPRFQGLVRYFYREGGRRSASISYQELRARTADGLLHQGSLVWRKGLRRWLALRRLPEVADMRKGMKPAPRPASGPNRPAAPPPAPPHRPPAPPRLPDPKKVKQWRTNTEWFALRVGGGTSGFYLNFSLFNIRWRHFYWTIIDAGMKFGGTGFTDYGMIFGFPLHLGDEGRHEVRFGGDSPSPSRRRGRSRRWSPA